MMLHFPIKTEIEAKSVVDDGHQIILSRFTNNLVIPEIYGYIMFDGYIHESRFRMILKEDNPTMSDAIFEYQALYGIINEGMTTRIIDYYRFSEYYKSITNQSNDYIFTTYVNELDIS